MSDPLGPVTNRVLEQVLRFNAVYHKMMDGLGCGVVLRGMADGGQGHSAQAALS